MRGQESVNVSGNGPDLTSEGFVSLNKEETKEEKEGKEENRGFVGRLHFCLFPSLPLVLLRDYGHLNHSIHMLNFISIRFTRLNIHRKTCQIDLPNVS